MLRFDLRVTSDSLLSAILNVVAFVPEGSGGRRSVGQARLTRATPLPVYSVEALIFERVPLPQHGSQAEIRSDAVKALSDSCRPQERAKAAAHESQGAQDHVCHPERPLGREVCAHYTFGQNIG